MLILGLEDPEGGMHYVAGAFPSACGKTNLAMLVPPASMPGWKARTVGDDIAWLRPARTAGCGRSTPRPASSASRRARAARRTRTAFDMVQRNTIFTNVALRPDGTPWWEGHDDPPPAEALDWQGRPWTPASTEKAAHPNSRFTTPAAQCASLSPEFEDPEGVPIDAILFGARAQRRVPLVYEARDWQHGTFLGATLVVGDDRGRDRQGRRAAPRPDGDAALLRLQHGRLLRALARRGRAARASPPQIFRVNWFRTGDDGRFLWPGFGENLRVLKWILERCRRPGRGGRDRHRRGADAATRSIGTA